MQRQQLMREQITGEAADWFANLEPSGAGTADDKEFAEWLLRSPTHIEEFLAVSRLWGEMPAVDTHSKEELIRTARADSVPRNIVSLLETEQQAKEVRSSALSATFRRRSKVRYSIAASVGIFLAALGAVLLSTLGSSGNRIVTAIGEQRSVTLADGSTVYLNTNSDLRIVFDGHERRITLVRGEARFSVTRDARRPFFVTTAQGTVRVLGTVFNVRTYPRHTAVTVIEGRVAVAGAVSAQNAANSSGDVRHVPDVSRSPNVSASSGDTLRRIELSAGEHAAISQGGEVLPDAGPSVEVALAWTERRLIFREDSLANVVAEFNRYQTNTLRIRSPELAAIKINGSFYAGDVASLVEYLQRYERVYVLAQPDGTRLLTSAP